MIINNFYEKPATIYLHKDKKTDKWVSNYELSDIWSCYPSYLSQGWSTDQFVKALEGLSECQSYFQFREYSKEAVEQGSGYYLINYGNSRTMTENIGLAFITPEIRDLINQGKLTLIISFVFETFDGAMSPKFWLNSFCSDLTAMGITKSNSVKILVNTDNDDIYRHRDSRIAWVYYPFFELVSQYYYKQSFELPPTRNSDTLKPYRFLNLNRRLRYHRLLLNVYLEFENLNHYGYITWPDDHDRYYYDMFYAPGNYFAEIRHNTFFEEFITRQKQLKGNYFDSYESDQDGNMSCQFYEALKFYDQADFEIINETHQNNIGPIVFLTEKTFRSLFAGIPFMLLGNPGSLRILHRLGYKTYPMLFDEKYNDKVSQLTSISLIVSEVKKFCNSNAHTNPFNTPEVLETIKHNQTVFWNKNHPKELYDLLTCSINVD